MAATSTHPAPAPATLVREARRHITRAARHDITLTLADFTVSEGDLYLDGMDPGEWLDAMLMD